MRRFFTWLGLYDADGRRAWAFLALLGASGVMTGFAAVVLYLVSADAGLTFWLGIAAHLQIAICITGFMAMFVKREVKAGKDGISVRDMEDDKDVH